jgi:hypothetical protein
MLESVKNVNFRTEGLMQVIVGYLVVNFTAIHTPLEESGVWGPKTETMGEAPMPREADNYCSQKHSSSIYHPFVARTGRF